MTYRSNAIPQRMREEAAYAFQEVPFVHVERMGWNRTVRGRHPVAAVGDNYMLQIVVRGWSPTYHSTLVTFDLDLLRAAAGLPGFEQRHVLDVMTRADELGVDMLVRLMLSCIADPTAMLMDRAMRAAATGIERPLRMTGPRAAHDGQRLAVGHIHIDRSVALHLTDHAHSETDPLMSRRMIEHAVATAHRLNAPPGETADVTNSAITQVHLHDWAGLPVADLGIGLGEKRSFFANRLKLPETLPETVLAACIGRPVGDVVSGTTGMAALFADRTIVDARQIRSGVEFTLEADTVLVESIWPTTPRRTTTRKERS